jgi:DNA polymerase-3 subunit gamma/tau
MLGTLGTDQVVALVDALAAGDGARLVAQARELAGFGPDFAQVLAEMLSLLRRVAVVQTLGAAAADVDDDPAVQRLAVAMSAEECQLYYQLGLLARRDLPLAPEPQAGFEMALLRMLAFRPVELNAPASAPPVAAPRAPVDTAAQAASPPTAGARAAVTAPRPASVIPAAPAPAAPVPAAAAPVSSVPVSSVPVSSAPVEPPAPARSADTSPATLNWNGLVPGLEAPPLARELARNSALRGFDGRVIELAVSPQYENLRGERTIKALEQALAAELGREVVVRVGVEGRAGLATPARAMNEQEQARLAELRRRIDADPNVQALQREFGASVEKVESTAPRGPASGRSAE